MPHVTFIHGIANKPHMISFGISGSADSPTTQALTWVRKA